MSCIQVQQGKAWTDIWQQGAFKLTVAGHQGQVRDLPHTTCPTWYPDSWVGAVAGVAAAVPAWVAAWVAARVAARGGCKV